MRTGGIIILILAGLAAILLFIKPIFHGVWWTIGILFNGILWIVEGLFYSVLWIFGTLIQTIIIIAAIVPMWAIQAAITILAALVPLAALAVVLLVVWLAFGLPSVNLRCSHHRSQQPLLMQNKRR